MFLCPFHGKTDSPTSIKLSSLSYTLAWEGYINLLWTLNVLFGNEMVAAKNLLCGLDVLSHIFTIVETHKSSYFCSVSFKNLSWIYTLYQKQFLCYHFSNFLTISVFVEGEAAGRVLAGLAHGVGFKRPCLWIDTLFRLINFKIVLPFRQDKIVLVFKFFVLLTAAKRGYTYILCIFI